MIDTHAHINIKPHKDKVDLILSNALKNGVNNIISIGMDYKTSLIAIKQSEQYKNIYASVGIHPAYVDNSNHHDLNKLYKNKKVIAIGEIGLDFYHTDKNKDLQIKVFEEQLIKAVKLNLPVIIHTRNSFDETYQIVKKYHEKITGVFHCFSSNLEDAMKAIELGFYIGLDGPLTFKKNNEELIKIAKEVPLNKILLETDSPYLTPEPKRGKVNEPANLIYIAEKLAKIKEVSLEEVISETTKNAKELFKIGGDVIWKRK